MTKTTKPPESEAGKHENSEGNASKHPERIARLGQCKKRSAQMAMYIQNLAQDLGIETYTGKQLNKLSNNVKSCGNYLKFHNYYTVEQIRLAEIKTCKKHMLCPVCARIRASKTVKQYLEKLNSIRQNRPNDKLALLTLTVKNGEDLLHRFDHLQKSWKKLQKQRRDFLNRGGKANELCKVNGAVFSYEFTKGRDGWHPHIHAIVLLDEFIDQKKLSKEWLQVTGDSSIVDIRAIKGNPAEGFLEVFKYALKFSELDLADNLEAYAKLKGKRLQGAFGTFWGVQVPETMTDTLYDDLPYLELFYRYQGYGRYDLQRISESQEAVNA